jgi:hypothetical protein
MNCERSQRRDWQRIVAMGLGRQLTKQEAREVADAWRAKKAAFKARRGSAFTQWPSTFVARWKPKTEAI